MPMMTRISDQMFRARVMQLTGQPYQAYENKAFGLMREGLTEAALAKKQQPRLDVYADQIVWGRSPVRIDLAGGWTDTPPYCLNEGGNVADWAGILTAQERETLEQQAQELTENYAFGVYLATVQDYEDLDAVDAYDAAQAVYHGYALGYGSDRDGVLLLLSMEDRDYALIVNGEYGRYAFNDSGRPAMTEFFLDDFGRDAWYEGFSDYLEWCGNYLDAAKNGEPYSDENPPMDAAGRTGAIMIRVAAIVILPLIIAFITILVLGSKMKSVAAQTRAERYIKGNLILTDSQEQYTHTTQTREKIKKDSETKNRSSGDTAGTTGKF